MKVLGVIPARYASTRFEGKALADIFGKPMIQHVYERASKAETIDELVVATDDQRIVDAVKAFGGNVETAKQVGETIAERLLAKGCKEVVFDRGGWVFHGRVKALAEAARAKGLQF